MWNNAEAGLTVGTKNPRSEQPLVRDVGERRPPRLSPSLSTATAAAGGGREQSADGGEGAVTRGRFLSQVAIPAPFRQKEMASSESSQRPIIPETGDLEGSGENRPIAEGPQLGLGAGCSAVTVRRRGPRLPGVPSPRPP